jgi:hypothetical protein
MYPYNKEIFKEDKGMSFKQYMSPWGSLAEFILSAKTSMFNDTIDKLKNPDVRDRILEEAKRTMIVKRTMTEDQFSDSEDEKIKKSKFAE